MTTRTARRRLVLSRRAPNLVDLLLIDDGSVYLIAQLTDAERDTALARLRTEWPGIPVEVRHGA